MFHVFVSLPTPQASLAAFEDGSSHHLIIYREARDFTDALGQFVALIIASLALALFGEGNGYDAIDTLKEIAHLQFTGHQTPHHLTNLRVVLVFHFVEDVGCLSMGFIVEERCCTFYGNLTPENLSHDVLIGIQLETCTRQMEVAFATDGFLRDREPLPTDHTSPR
jgi:hypothetical protein